MLPSSAVEHYQEQQRITVAAAEQVDAIWRSGMGDDFDLSWSRIAPDVFEVVAAAQFQAAVSGLDYVPAVLDDLGIDGRPVADVDPARFMGGTRDGRPLETLLHGSVYKAKQTAGLGLSAAGALAAGGDWLMDVTLDSVRDANRQAVAAATTVRPKVGGWVRMMNPPSCKFCITLAGKWFRWNQGFQSHPGCDCRHIPANESVAGDLTVDPYAYFHSLPAAEQDRLFGKADAQAIRDGSDIYRVVNIRSRGLASDALKKSGDRRGWQSRRYGTPSLMTVDDVYAAATSREHAIQLLRENGFVTGEQVAGGNILGDRPSDFAAGALGAGGRRVGATAAYRKAVRSGVRDPLEPATQTAAERRLHQAVLMKRAVDAGRNPFGSGPLTAAGRDLVNRQYRRELDRLASAPDQVRVLARLLGI